jgi:type VI secretion system protein ImpK
MQQPAANLYLLELIYLLLSLGFEGKYRLQDRGPLTLESLRDSLFKQIRLLRGEPAPDLSKKIAYRTFKNKTYAYVPRWLVAAVVVFCLAVTFWGFSFTLGQKAEPLLAQYSSHAPKSDTDATEVRQ